MVKVKIKGQVITAQYGTLKSDDILTCSEEFARHLVHNAHAAEYVQAPVDPEQSQSAGIDQPPGGNTASADPVAAVPAPAPAPEPEGEPSAEPQGKDAASASKGKRGNRK